MPFGNKAEPSKVYKYGCKVQVEDLPFVFDTLRNAHKYRNKLVELELLRREQIDFLVCNLSPRLLELDNLIKLLSTEIESDLQQIKTIRKNDRKRTPADNVLKHSLSIRRNMRKEYYNERRELRKSVFASDAFKDAQRLIEEAHQARHKDARANSNINWGTYLAVEQAMSGTRSGSPPRFRRYDGGRLAVQIQKGIPVHEAFTGNDSRIHITPTNNKKLFTAKIRLSKDKTISITFNMHRPLPQFARIKWVWLVGTRVATRTIWSLQFVLSQENGWDKTCADSGVVAVNLGWRSVVGGIRAATFYGDDGQTGTLTLDDRHIGRISEYESLQSIRDKNFDTIRLQFTSWLKQNESILPVELAEETQHLSQWRSQARLAALILRWRNSRFPGDEQIFQTLEDWRKQDKHLYEWAQNSIRKFQDHRKDAYRTFADSLAKQYRTLIIGNIGWKKMQDKPTADEADEMKLARQRKRITSPATFEKCLSERFAITNKIPAENMTATCYNCGNLSLEPNPEKLQHACEICGTIYDQDQNHCRNLLASAGVVVTK